MQNEENVQAAADRVLEMEEELEASGHISVQAEALAQAKAALQEWVDQAVGVISTPALGRVTLIHPGNQHSTIASATLPFVLSKPIA